VFRGRAQRLHFVGIGGTGMNGIAEVLLNLGYDVRGSDAHPTIVTARLAAMGATIYDGHIEGQLRDADVVVTSTAIKSDNPEVVEARQRGIPVIRRAEMLAELMRLKYGVAIAGTHGKTTTTSLVAAVLAKGGIDPTVVIGGRLKAFKTGARLGEGEYLVAEADESDGSFLKLLPTIAVVTNIDAEHLDHWTGGLTQIVDGFVAFVNKIPFYGCAVLCLDHPTVQAMLPRVEKRYVTYGLGAKAEYVGTDIECGPGHTSFVARRRGEILGKVRVNLIGRHNVQNCLAAIAVGDEVGVPFAVAAHALSEFEGIARRFEIKGTANDVMVVDDYGHHPAEIRATLEAAKLAYNRRLIVAFQPHRYTRTRDLWNEFLGAFNAADVLLLTDIYPAGEAPIEGIDAAALAQAIGARGSKDVRWVSSLGEVATSLREIVRPGDLVLTLGAGSIWQSGEELLVYLREASRAAGAPESAKGV